MKTHTINTYTISEHPEPDKVYTWVRENWHDLGYHIIEECSKSLEEFSKYMDSILDYSISPFLDRREYLRIKPDEYIFSDDVLEYSGEDLSEYLKTFYPKLLKNCPFTGVCYDDTILDVFREFIKKPDNRTIQDLLNEVADIVLEYVHKEVGYLYSDEGLKEFLEDNGYNFTIDGELFNT